MCGSSQARAHRQDRPGPVTRTIPETDELLREITERYLPPEKVPDYLALAKTFSEQVVIYLRPERWLSSDLGPN